MSESFLNRFGKDLAANSTAYSFVSCRVAGRIRSFSFALCVSQSGNHRSLGIIAVGAGKALIAVRGAGRLDYCFLEIMTLCRSASRYGLLVALDTVADHVATLRTGGGMLFVKAVALNVHRVTAHRADAVMYRITL